MCCETLSQLLGSENCRFFIAVRQDDEKLLASISPHRIGAAHQRHEAFSCFLQDEITDHVAIAVVDQFEPVNIDHNDCQRASLSSAGFQLLCQELKDSSAVARFSQYVGGGQVMELTRALAQSNFRGLTLGNVARNPNEVVCYEGQEADLVVLTMTLNLNLILEADFGLVKPYFRDRIPKGCSGASRVRALGAT